MAKWAMECMVCHNGIAMGEKKMVLPRTKRYVDKFVCESCYWKMTEEEMAEWLEVDNDMLEKIIRMREESLKKEYDEWINRVLGG